MMGVSESIIGLTAVVLIFGIPILLILMLPFIILAKGIVGKGKAAPVNEEERQKVQKIYSDLERMEKRIESLETILIAEFKHESAAGGRSPMDEPPPFK